MRIGLLVILLFQFTFLKAGMLTIATVPATGNKKVYIIQVQDGNYIVKDSVEGEAFFVYTTTTPGYYTAKVVYTETNDYLPTYMGNKAFWNESDSVYVGAAVSDSVGQEVSIIPVTPLSGEGSISGSIMQGNFKVAAGAPLDKVQVLLLDESTGSPVFSTYTNTNGAYQFSNLPFGSYKVYVEVPGKKNENPPVVTLNSSSSEVSQVNLSIGSKGVQVTSVLKKSERDLFNCYPNPMKETIFIEMNTAVQQFQLLDSRGMAVATETNPIFVNSLNVSKLTPGVYYLRAVTEGGLFSMKKLVKE